MALSNPLGFTRSPVTIITTVIYIALIAILVLFQVDLPSTPSSSTPVSGINPTEAWQDLQLLTSQYHPYNSRRNDVVHDWLLHRIKQILKRNNASATDAYIFDDQVSNLTSSTAGVGSLKKSATTVYFEGTNIITYVRGTEDDDNEWWEEEVGEPSERHGVMVNAHYDSVSTGYGSTDDGVGVISVLQLIQHFTSEGRQPRNGLVLLLNNGEEDFLNGARAFGQHPMSRFVNTFLNLEGAGAGGRAALFRSTDEEVTKAYANSPYPFGTVVSGDAFARGLVRSQTDYVVFNEAFGYRGLDVAFIGPRARYHTNQDDSRHTGQKALWHMLSAAIATTRSLTGKSVITPDTDSHRAIWFDILGQVFAVLQTHTFFSLSIAVLVVGPILLLATLAILARADKLYLFAGSRNVHTSDGDNPVSLLGWRGFFRFPFVMLFSAAGPVALAYLLFKENEEIVHSSPWSVWAMMVSAFVFVAWFLARFADYVRPSALTRAFGFGWICAGWWLLLVVALVHEEQLHLSSGYFALFFSASAFLATWLSYLELFSLPKKKSFCREKVFGDDASVASRPVSRPGSSRRVENDNTNDEEEDATEQSSLLRRGGRSARAYQTQSRNDDDDTKPATGIKEKLLAKHDEQEWSASMWDWMWILQILILVPINVILIGQIGFYLVEALHQTGEDGSSSFIVYLGIAIVTILIFSPIVPIIHRFSWHIPIFLLLVLVGTLVYNLLAFPFSPQNRVKLYFQQQVDLDHGNNTVSLLGVTPYVEMAISEIPSAAGQHVKCHPSENRRVCSWTGPAPQVNGINNGFTYAKSPYRGWVNYNASIISDSRSTTKARINISGKNTRACKLLFDKPVSDIYVHGQSPQDKRLPAIPEEGASELRLWSRTWNRTWTVDLEWDSKRHGKSLSGRAVCMWSDVNQKGVIPAFDEVQHYVPTWAAITKAGDGLVEGSKGFNITR